MSFSQKKKIHYKTSYVPGDLVSGQATEQNCSGDTRKSQGQVCCWWSQLHSQRQGEECWAEPRPSESTPRTPGCKSKEAEPTARGLRGIERVRTYIMFWSEAWAITCLRTFCLHFYLCHLLWCDRLSFHHLLTIFLGSASHLHCKEVKQWSYCSEAEVVVGNAGNIVCIVCWGSIRVSLAPASGRGSKGQTISHTDQPPFTHWTWSTSGNPSFHPGLRRLIQKPG